MDKQTRLEPIRRRPALIGVGIAAALGVVAGLAWPALMRADPPLETSAPLDQQMKINLVQPPRAVEAVLAERLDVGLSATATPLTQGRQALVEAGDPPPPRPPRTQRQAPPVERAFEPAAEIDEDALQQESYRRARARDDRWERERWERESFQADRNARWDRQRRAEDERQARDDDPPERDPW